MGSESRLDRISCLRRPNLMAGVSLGQLQKVFCSLQSTLYMLLLTLAMSFFDFFLM